MPAAVATNSAANPPNSSFDEPEVDRTVSVAGGVAPEDAAGVGDVDHDLGGGRGLVAQLGERLRALRIAKGLTQTELAGERFSKEYVSQIERGKTAPSAEALAWLAPRLGTVEEIFAPGLTEARWDTGHSP